MPSREGSIELLRPYVNLTDADFRLLVVWMAAAIRPVGPYPMLALYGEQGSAKSTLARIVRRLIDPQAAPLLAEPRNISRPDGHGRQRLAAGLRQRRRPAAMAFGWPMPAGDRRWLRKPSIVLERRGELIHVQRPVILNGIDEFVRRGDLTDRSRLPRPAADLPPTAAARMSSGARFTRTIRESWGAYSMRSSAACATAVAQLTELPRMADFAAFAEAVGRGLGWPEGMVLEDYNDNRRQATTTLIEGSPVGTVLLEYARYLNGWIGTADELLCKLNAFAGRIAASAHWPKSPVWLARELRRIAPQLCIHDIFVMFHRTDTQRLISVSTADHAEKIPSLDASVTEQRLTSRIAPAPKIYRQA